MLRRLLLGFGFAALGLTLTWGSPGSGARTEEQSSFAAEVAALSEPAGYFDTDNLISNERSYLDVMPDLRSAACAGGAYIGVGPDQNFSYIAAIRPDVAFIVDVRRDNLLAPPAVQGDLHARAHQGGIPGDAVWPSRTGQHRCLAHRAARSHRRAHRRAAIDERSVAALRERLDEVIARTGVPLTRPEIWRPSTGSIAASSRRASSCASNRPGVRRRATTPPIETCSSPPIRSANAATTSPPKRPTSSSGASSRRISSSRSSAI